MATPTGWPTTRAGRWSSTSTRRTTRRGAPRRPAHFETICPSSTRARPRFSGISGQGEASKAQIRGQVRPDTSRCWPTKNYEVAEKYGVWQKKWLYGRTFMGLSRTTYLIGADGQVVKRWDKVKVNAHADEVLDSAVEDVS